MGSSSEGQNGIISELLAQNGISTTVKQHIAALNKLGGLEVLRTPSTDNQYHAGWAWAGSTLYKGTKLLASHLGGTGNPTTATTWCRPSTKSSASIPRGRSTGFPRTGPFPDSRSWVLGATGRRGRGEKIPIPPLENGAPRSFSTWSTRRRLRGRQSHRRRSDRFDAGTIQLPFYRDRQGTLPRVQDPPANPPVQLS
jgi:hypothetical protein